MYKILLATDGSAHSFKIIGEAVRMNILQKAEITVLSVGDWTSLTKNIEKKTKKIVEEAVDSLKKFNIDASTRIEKGSKPAEIICQVANEGNFDLIIIGSRGLSGLKSVVLGSVSNEVAQKAKTNVLIIK